MVFLRTFHFFCILAFTLVFALFFVAWTLLEKWNIFRKTRVFLRKTRALLRNICPVKHRTHAAVYSSGSLYNARPTAGDMPGLMAECLPEDMTREPKYMPEYGT